MQPIDLNADVGEGFDSDRALLELVTSASIACGFHAGDAATMRSLCAAAVAAGVSLGAHVGYRDRAGFGRRALGVDAATVEAEAVEQIDALAAAASAAGGRVTYLKPHGALYHRASSDGEIARALVSAAAGRGLAVLAFPGSALLAQAGAAGLLAVAEGFADRGYAEDGTLLPRGEADAVLDGAAAARQAVDLAGTGAVRSLCVHGDSPAAAAVASAVRSALVTAGAELRAFA